MASERKCQDLLKNLFSDMNNRLQNGEYSQSGGYDRYCRDRDAIVEKYRREPNKGVSVRTLSVCVFTKWFFKYTLGYEYVYRSALNIYVYVQAEAVLNEFLNERGAEANSILHTDTKLTENDRKMQGRSLPTV